LFLQAFFLADSGVALRAVCDEESKVGEFSLEEDHLAAKQAGQAGQAGAAPQGEDSAARGKRLAELLRMRLKEAMMQRDGSQALLYWLRSDGGESAKAD
jgi:hypothetical protein